MPRIILFSCACFLLFFCSSCEEDLDQNLLYGDWQAHEYKVSGKSKATDLSKINFNFNAKNVYTFQGGPIHKEAGNYKISGNILYSTDTLNTDRIEKAVKITSTGSSKVLL